MSPENIPTGTEVGAIHLVGYEEMLAKSVEVVRIWVQDHGPGTFIICPDRLASPEMFGMMLTDCARHAARAYARDLEISEGVAIERIWEGCDMERDHPTDEPETIDMGGPH